MKKTIAQQLNIKEFPFKIKNSKGKLIYFEDLEGSWIKREFDSDGNRIYFENSSGYIEDNRPKSCEGKIVEVEGKKYKLTAI